MSKIRERLKKQKEIEGNTHETALLLRVLPLCKFRSDWQAMTTVKNYRYGPMSYEVHKFYYPSPLLKNLEHLFTDESGHPGAWPKY